MLKLYKKLYYGYFAVSFIGSLALLTAAFVFMPDANIGAVLLYAISFIVAVALFFQMRANKKYRSLLEIMTQKCAVKRFTEESLAVLEANKRLEKNAYIIMRLNICAGYLNLGDAENAKQILDETDLSKARGKQTKANIEFMKEIHYSTYYFLLNDAENARIHAENAEKALEQVAVSPETRNNHYPTVNVAMARVYMLNGSYDKAEQIFASEAANAGKKLRRVHANYFLGIIYESRGETEKAFEAYEFAAENGDSISSVKARAALERLKS